MTTYLKVRTDQIFTQRLSESSSSSLVQMRELLHVSSRRPSRGRLVLFRRPEKLLTTYFNCQISNEVIRWSNLSYSYLYASLLGVKYYTSLKFTIGKNLLENVEFKSHYLVKSVIIPYWEVLSIFDTIV